MLKYLFKYRSYINENAWGELKYRYAGSSLGIFWNILNPLLQILVYTFVFSNIMQAKVPSLNNMGSFSLYLCSGMFAWLAFQECLSRGTNTFIENSSFLKKLAVPEIVFVAQKAYSTFLNCIINYCIIFVYSIIVLRGVNVYWLGVPLILLLLMLFGFGLTMILSTLNVFFRDTFQIVSVMLMVWMWMTPIVYVKEILPEGLWWVLSINPVYPFINSLQQIIVFGNAPEWKDVAVMVLAVLISNLLGGIVLKKFTSEIRDLI